MLMTSIFIVVASCQQERPSRYDMADRSSLKDRSTDHSNFAGTWTGYRPIEKIVTTRKPIDTIVVIDSGDSTFTEISRGFQQMIERAARRAGENKPESDYEVRSKDHTYMILDDNFSLFQNGEQTTIVNTPVDSNNLLHVLQEFLSGVKIVDPAPRSAAVKNIVIITDQDISEAQVAAFQNYLIENREPSEIYLHTISARADSQASSWCQFVAIGTQVNLMKKQLQLSGLELDICHNNWYELFQRIGQKMAFDWSIAELKLPESLIINDQSVYLKVDGITLPRQLYWYHQENHAMRMKITDVPSSVSLIEVGYYSGEKLKTN